MRLDPKELNELIHRAAMQTHVAKNNAAIGVSQGSVTESLYRELMHASTHLDIAEVLARKITQPVRISDPKPPPGNKPESDAKTR